MPKSSSKSAKSSKEQVFERIKLSDNSEIRISLITFHEDADEVLVNVRKFYKTKNDPTWKPARQGITLPIEKAKAFRVKLKTICERSESDDSIIEYVERKGNE